MKFSMTVNMDNSAFDDQAELVNILKTVIKQYKEGQTGMGLSDSNGNRVGQWVLEGDPELD